MKKTAPSPPSISIPLPLSVRFGLLPTLIPGDNLAPVLYSLINDIPIYVTLSPSHQPHLSLLPLLLSLKPPIPPLHILTALKLTPRDYSVDLDAAAPYPDLWVPFPVARNICDRLGVSKLFWDDKDGTRGILSDAVKDAVSWDEGGTIGHNWLPPTSQLPASSYSLAALLDTSFVGIAVIPGDRCTFTPIDPSRRASIIASAEDRDHSRIRRGRWRDSWESMLRWTVLAWEDYLKHPSKPPRPKPHISQLADLPSIVHRLLPAFASPIGTQPTFTPALNDLQSLFEPTDECRSHITPPQLQQTAWSMIAQFVPFLHSASTDTPTSLSRGHAKQRQLRARVMLGMVESLSLLLMDTWNTERDRRRLEKLLEGRGLPAPMVIDCRLLDAEEAHIEAHRAAEQRETLDSKLYAVSKVQDWRRQDSLDDLRRARGGSPVSTPGTVTPLEAASVRRPPTPLSSGSHFTRAVTGTASGAPDERNLRRRAVKRSRHTDGSASDRERSSSRRLSGDRHGDLSSQDGLYVDDPYPTQEVMLLSERREGWWMYFVIMGATIVAIAFGMGYGTLTLAQRSVVVGGQAVHVNWRGGL